MKFKYFLFDWDGCLANTLPVWFGGMREALAYFNINVPDSTIKKGFQGWDIFPELGVPDMDIFTREVYKYVNNNLGSVNFNEGVLEILMQLKEKNIRCAIVTTTERDKVQPVLKKLELADYFDCIVDRNDVEKLKPHHEAIDKAMDFIQGDKKLTVMVGDSDVDMMAGKNAGVSTIWFSPNRNKDYHVHINTKGFNPDFTIDHFKELGRFF